MLIVPCAGTAVDEIQQMKSDCLPWTDWVMGPKVAQAMELADWLYYVMHEAPEACY